MPGSTAPGGAAQVLVWDASPLYHAIKADKIDLLGDIARASNGVPRRNLSTDVVRDEIGRHDLPLDGLQWLEFVEPGPADLRELATFATWAERLSVGGRNEGEATVLAWAEVHGVVAVIDDGAARKMGLRVGIAVRGSLSIIAESVRDGHTTAYAATALVDAMIDTGMRYPCQPGQFVPWAKQNNLL